MGSAMCGRSEPVRTAAVACMPYAGPTYYAAAVTSLEFVVAMSVQHIVCADIARG